MWSMLNKPNTPTGKVAQLKVMETLKDRACTWKQIQSATQFNDDHLGIVLGELLLQRMIKTESKNDVRIYWLIPI